MQPVAPVSLSAGILKPEARFGAGGTLDTFTEA
jgi:hypothetical protein